MAAEPQPLLRRADSIVLDEDIKDIDKQLSEPKGRERHANFAEFVPPHAPQYTNPASIFLAGSIEMGKAIQWQSHLTKELQDLPVTVCNPRRGQWSTDLVPGAMDILFKQQVEWELAALEDVDVICFFFDKNTLSPVTMLELGLWAGSGKVVVCCHKDFWKSGNIHHVCMRYGVPFVTDYADLVELSRQKLKYIIEGKSADEAYRELMKSAERLRTEREEKEREKKRVAETGTKVTPTIDKHLKYVRPMRVAFKSDTKELDSVEQRKLWADLCSFN